MKIGQNQSVVDQVFRAIDNKNYAIASYKLCRAIESANAPSKPTNETTPDREGQA